MIKQFLARDHQRFVGRARSRSKSRAAAAVTLAALTAGALFGPAASAHPVAGGLGWHEDGDAGELCASAQNVGKNPKGTPLVGIAGSTQPNSDIDVYRIGISDPASFSASTVGRASFDTQLFLFNKQCQGVLANDDSQGTLQSTIPALAPGGPAIYFLAISSFDNDALDCNGDLLFLANPFTGVSGPNSNLPLCSWSGSGFSGGKYGIELTGAVFLP